MSERPLEGRRTVVLGAAGNAGPAMVAALAAAGATVAGVGRDAGPIEAVEGISSAHAADLLDPAAVRGLAGELGGVDVVVHLVGGWRGNGPIAEVGDDEWAALEGPLFRTVLNATRAFAPALARSPHGRFLLVSSQQAQAPTATNAVYATAKAAAEARTLALADEFRAGESAATANVLVVKAIVTDAMRAAKPEGRFPGFTSADALARAAVFACSDAGATMNGQRLELHSVKATAAVSFASDNHAGVHPEAMEAIAAANVGHAPAYGDDAWTRELEERCREVFGDVAVFPVFNGTGANVTSLAALLRPHQSVICAETAHVNVDECGAPERFAGCKMVDLPTPDGKLTPEIVDRGLVGIGDEHHVQARVVTVTQATELGTVYGIDELRRLTDHAHRNGLLVHMDGARIANAAAALDAGLAEVTGGAGVDVLSFGGTKNGLLAAEAVVFFDRSLATDFLYVRKQAMQLSSKMRFASAQLIAMLENDLWRRNAAHANAMAQRLAAGLAGIAGVELAQPVQANGVFAQLPRAAVAPLQERYPFYVIDEDAVIARFMCSWDTRPEDVDDFLGAIAVAVA